MTDQVDFLIVGGGIAGAGLGAELARRGRVLVIEMEGQPGYHATGRSVAFWTETYGGPLIQPLTAASGPLMRQPEAGMGDAPFLSARGALHVGRESDRPVRDAMLAEFAGSSVDLNALDGAALAARVPGLRPDWVLGIDEPSCEDIDAAALHGAMLSAIRRQGSRVQGDCRLLSAQREGDGWLAQTSAGPVACGVLVNAAGAWADEVARACGVGPVGITPLRRTVVQLRIDPAAPDDLPVILDLAGSFYFKPVAGGRVWLSPHDEAPSDPCDAAPEELAVAQAIDRFQQVVDWRVEAVERRWAGLRSFAPDRLPIYGFDPFARGFFWCAGQGGWGIQTALAAAKMAAALATGEAPESSVAAIDASVFDPGRFEI
ncbi:MAG: FAD-binding oxidoreductase [Sphingobium sp.]|nr:FAD-binding oxidoreductase [Sphingobium sp.]